LELDGKRPKKHFRSKMTESAARVRADLQSVKDCCGNTQAAIGATFSQVSRDLEIFVRHVLSVCQTAPFTSHPAAAIEIAKRNNPLGFEDQHEIGDADRSSNGGSEKGGSLTKVFHGLAVTTPHREHDSSNANDHSGDGCVRVKVICALDAATHMSDEENVSLQTCVRQIDDRAVRVDGGMVPKTYVFDKVLRMDVAVEGRDEDSLLAKAVSECALGNRTSHYGAGRSGSYCVVSMGGLDHPGLGKDLGTTFEGFLNHHHQEGDDRMKEEVSITAVEIMGEDGFRDLLAPSNSTESPRREKAHRVQSDSHGFVWVTGLVGVTINSRSDFERVCRIVHERRSR
jgi:hypothetical protein